MIQEDERTHKHWTIAHSSCFITKGRSSGNKNATDVNVQLQQVVWKSSLQGFHLFYRQNGQACPWPSNRSVSQSINQLNFYSAKSQPKAPHSALCNHKKNQLGSWSKHGATVAWRKKLSANPGSWIQFSMGIFTVCGCLQWPRHASKDYHFSTSFFERPSEPKGVT